MAETKKNKFKRHLAGEWLDWRNFSLQLLFHLLTDEDERFNHTRILRIFNKMQKDKEWSQTEMDYIKKEFGEWIDEYRKEE